MNPINEEQLKELADANEDASFLKVEMTEEMRNAMNDEVSFSEYLKTEDEHILELEQLFKKMIEENGPMSAHLSVADAERWSRLTKSERARLIVEFLKAPVVEDKEIF